MTNYVELIGQEMADVVACRDPRPETQALVDGILPLTARGNNAVLVAPPSTTYAYAALVGVYHHLREGEGTRGLVLVPEGTLDAWRNVADTASLDLEVHLGNGQARAARALASGTTDVLVTTLATATALQQRALLKVDALRSVVLIWPELWSDYEALTGLMTDAKEAQRVVITSDLPASASLIERYARKAMTVGAPPADQQPLAPLGPVRTVVANEQEREAAVRAIEETLDPATMLIEGACAEDSFYFGPTLPAPDAEVTNTAAVVLWDLPLRGQLERALSTGPVVVIVPPYAEGWAAANLGGRRPLVLSSPADAARDEAARRRGQIHAKLAAGTPTSGLLSLAPLFEQHDATLVAAALYEMWTAQSAATPTAVTATTASTAPTAATGTMWVSAGSMDGIQPKDIVGALVNEIKVERAAIGKVDVREKFTLVELPAAEIERVAQAFTGTTIKRKRVLARADRARDERPARGDRPMGRGRPGGDRPVRKPRPRD